MIGTYLSLYAQDTPRWERVEDASSALGFGNLVSSTTAEYLLSKGVAANYISEVVEAATRVNYAQDTDVIHALEGACSMAVDNAAGVAGGNFQLFEQFLKRSKATVFLNTTVSVPIFGVILRQLNVICPRSQASRLKATNGQ
jgi:prenylcysteine oxidase/farnesylcysteine lyase